MWNTMGTLPPEHRLLDTKSAKGMEQKLIRIGNLFWTPDKKMYVYYTPMYWKLA